MTEHGGASEVNWGVIGLLGHLDQAGRDDGADPFSTREGQLDQLLSVTGEVVGGELKPEIALRRLSEAAERFITHDLADIGRTEAVARARELGLLPLDTLSPA